MKAWAIFVLVVIASCLHILLNLWFTKSKAMSPISVILFKLPRSGSSWMTERLNSYPNVFLCKEIMQRRDNITVTPEQQMAGLQSALISPSDKLRFRFRTLPLPSNRFLNDFIVSSKWWRTLDIVGFTLNPEHVTGIDWGTLLGNSANTRLVVLRRSNVIKSAISGYRGRLLHSSTGLSNLPEHNHRLSLRFQHMSARTHRTPSNGSISTTALVPWDAKTFCTEVNWWMRRMKVFEDAVHRASLEASLTPVIVYYEALQNDLYSTLKNLIEGLSPRFQGENNFILQSGPKFLVERGMAVDVGVGIGMGVAPQASRWVKRSQTENLRETLVHYEEIWRFLDRDSCACLLLHLRSEAPEVIPQPCLLHINQTTGLCQSLLE